MGSENNSEHKDVPSEDTGLLLEKSILNSTSAQSLADRKTLTRLMTQEFFQEKKAKSLVKIILEGKISEEKTIHNLGISAGPHHRYDELSYAIRELEYDRKHGPTGKRIKTDEVYEIMYDYTLTRLKELRKETADMKRMPKNDKKISYLENMVNGKSYVNYHGEKTKGSSVHEYKDRMLTLWKEVEKIKFENLSSEDKDTLAYVSMRLKKNKRLKYHCRKDGQLAYLKMILSRNIDELVNSQPKEMFREYFVRYNLPFNSQTGDSLKS